MNQGTLSSQPTLHTDFLELQMKVCLMVVTLHGHIDGNLGLLHFLRLLAALNCFGHHRMILQEGGVSP
jgi:hypothetical protein